MKEILLKEFSAKFDIHLETPEGTVHSFPARELVQEQGMRAFADCYGPLMKALDDKAVAAYFGGWIASLALAVQYSVTGFSVMPEFSLSNLNIHLIPAAGYCRVAFSLNEWKLERGLENVQGREAWRNQVLARFYRDTAGPLFRSISQISGLAPGEIWGQLPSKFNYYAEKMAAELSDAALLNRLEQDYNYLKDELPAAVFQLARNPFHVKVRRIEALDHPEQTVQMRNRCCLYYRTEGGRFCYTCPRMKEEARAERRAEFRSEMAAAQG